MPKPQPESVIKAHCLKYLFMCPEFFGWVVTNGGIWDPTRKIFRTRKGFGMRNGIADVCGIWKGRGLQIEIKTPVGQLNEAQRFFLSDFHRKGGVACVLRSVDDCIDLVSSLRLGTSLPNKLTKDFL